jgi:hypothetical protein
VRIEPLAKLLALPRKGSRAARGADIEAALAILIYAFILAEASIGPALEPAARAQCEEILLGSA